MFLKRNGKIYFPWRFSYIHCTVDDMCVSSIDTRVLLFVLIVLLSRMSEVLFSFIYSINSMWIKFTRFNLYFNSVGVLLNKCFFFKCFL